MSEEMDTRLVINALIPQLANKLQTVMDMGMEEVTARQWLPLVMIGRFPYEPTLKEIAEKCGITHQSAKQLLDKLVEKKYVNEKRDEKDRRCLRYSLTEKAKEWEMANLEKNQKFIQELFADISEEELATFCTVERRLIHKLDMFRSDPEYWKKILSLHSEEKVI